MKTFPLVRIFSVLFAAILLLTVLSSCSEPYRKLYEEEQDGITYCVRGFSGKPRHLVIKRGDRILFSVSIESDASVRALDEKYGLLLTDLNFDGKTDVLLPVRRTGECIEYVVFLQSEDGEAFTKSEELSGLCNLRADADRTAVFAFSHTYTTEKAYGDTPSVSVSTDRATKYVWENGIPEPEMYVSITYYSETGLYCYSVAYYDSLRKKFNDSDDVWLKPEEYADKDMSFLYYFR